MKVIISQDSLEDSWHGPFCPGCQRKTSSIGLTLKGSSTKLCTQVKLEHDNIGLKYNT